MEFYKHVVSPVLDRLDSEKLHHLIRNGLHLAEHNYPLSLAALEGLVFSSGKRFKSESLENEHDGLFRENTTQLGAGWDKPGKAQLAWHALGCGSTVVGGITPEPQAGNPDRPRQHVFKDRKGHYGEINFLGLNSDGRQSVVKNLEQYWRSTHPIIASVAYNSWTDIKDVPQDFAKVIDATYDYVDGFQLLISCPNVHGAEYVHRLHDYEFLKDIAQTSIGLMEELGVKKSTSIKVGGDVTMPELDRVARVCADYGLGIVGINTSSNEDFKSHFGKRDVKGGFSGDYEPYRQRALEVAAYVYNETSGQVPFIASGGIYTGEDAWQRHLSGSFINESVLAPRIYGLRWADKINRYLYSQLIQIGDDVKITDIIGGESQKYSKAGYPHISRM